MVPCQTSVALWHRGFENLTPPYATLPAFLDPLVLTLYPRTKVVFKGLIVLHTMIRTGNTENVLGFLAHSDPLRLQNVANGHWEGI